jgi:PilZ domain
MTERPQRYEIRLSAELRVGSQLVTGVTRNLSVGGVCVEIDRPVAEGEKLKLTLFVVEDEVEAEGARGLALAATVQWAAEADRGWALGLKFDPLTPQQAAALANALRAVTVS